MRRFLSMGASLVLTSGVLLLLLPVWSLMAAALQADALAWQVLKALFDTVLPEYIATSLWLCLGVALGVMVCGGITASLVAVCDFPGRRFLEWALLLPLAMPAYVVAYAYTDFLQFSGPLQTGLRASFGWQGRLLPEVRQLGGAVWVFTFTLYPYVYLLVRAALLERSVHLLEAARLLGVSTWRRWRELAFPLTRPAWVAGTALVLMETLADYGVSSYFGLQTFTAGIYKAWLALDNRWAAAQLALMLWLFVGLLWVLERYSRRRLRWAQTRDLSALVQAPVRQRLAGGPAFAAALVCAFPVLAGFVAPLLFMLWPLWGHWEAVDGTRFAQWSLNSLRLAGGSAILATGVALLLTSVQRQASRPWVGRLVAAVGCGYAIPGAVLVVGLLWHLEWWQTHWPEASWTGVLTASALGVVWVYLVRFTAVALQALQQGYARMPTSLDESARLLGTGGWALWWRLHRPLLQRPVCTAVLLVFVDVMKELPATLVLRPFGQDTLAVVTYQLARDERLAEASLPALTLVLVGLLPVWWLMHQLRHASK